MTANGTIKSGDNLNSNDTPPVGIFAGYSQTPTFETEPNVFGNVIIQSNATIIAAAASNVAAGAPDNGIADYGIEGVNWGIGTGNLTTGTGNVTITTGTLSSITVGGAGIGIAAFAMDGGDASITNDGIVNASTGIALYADVTGNAIATIINAGQVDGSVTGTGTIDFTNSGTIVADAGSSVSIAMSSFTNNGMLTVNGGAMTVDEAVTGSGSVTLGDGGILEFQSGVSAAQMITFTGNGVLKIENPTSFDGEISGITGSGDVLDLGGFHSQTGDQFETFQQLQRHQYNAHWLLTKREALLSPFHLLETIQSPAASPGRPRATAMAAPTSSIRR